MTSYPDHQEFLHDHSSKAFEVFTDLWQRSLLCDVTICVEHKHFQAHKVILAGCSPYLRAMFTNGMLESEKSAVSIRDIDPGTMEALLRYMYTGHVEVTFDNVQSILQGASMLNLTKLRSACCHFLQLHLDASNCLGILSLADMYSCAELCATTQDFIDRHFVDVVHCDEFLHLSQERLVKLLENENIQVANEEQVFEALMVWTNWELDARLGQACRVLECIHLDMLPDAYLQEFVLQTEFVRNCAECRACVQEVMDEIADDADDEEDDSQDSGSRDYGDEDGEMRSAIRDLECRISTHGIYVLGGRNREDCQLKSMERYDTLREQWIPMPSMSVARTAVGAASLDGEIYAVGGECALEDRHDETLYLSCVEVFDPVLFRWVGCADMLISRSFVSVSVVGGYLYAIGGENRDQSCSCMEKYDSRSDQWISAPPMYHRRAGAGVAVYDGKIYVAGGSDKSLHVDRGSIEYFDPETQKWQYLAEMERGRSGLTMACVDHSIYMIGGRARYLDRYYALVERYDLWTGSWTACRNMNTPRAWPTAVVLDNKIYVMGGYNGNKRLRSVEVYDPNTDTWTYTSTMNVCRAGCASTVL